MQTIRSFCRDNEMECAFTVEAIYLQTKCGNWKIIKSKHDGMFRLFHLNFAPEEGTITGHPACHYHRQRDVQPKDSMMSFLNYIMEHDKYKKVAEEDYRKLPRSTKRQRKYYRSAKKRDERRKAGRVMELFSRLEEENSGYKRISCKGMEV